MPWLFSVLLTRGGRISASPSIPPEPTDRLFRELETIVSTNDPPMGWRHTLLYNYHATTTSDSISFFQTTYTRGFMTRLEYGSHVIRDQNTTLRMIGRWISFTPLRNIWRWNIMYCDYCERFCDRGASEHWTVNLLLVISYNLLFIPGVRKNLSTG